MKQTAFPALALICAALATADASVEPQMTLTGDQRSISASGVAGGLNGSSSYAYSLGPSSLFASFSTNVSGSASWTDNTNVYPELAPGSYFAASGAEQHSSLSGNSFTCTSSIWGNDHVSLQGPYGPANPHASSLFDVSFTLTTQAYFELTLGFSLANYSTSFPSVDRGTPHLFSADDVDLLLAPEWEDRPEYGSFFRYSGLLDPGEYNLLVTQELNLPADPFGQGAFASYDLNFFVTSVPEPSAFALAASGLAVLLMLRRKRTI